MSAKPHVLIIGGGIGGLTLAQSLRKQGVTFDVFEKDTSTTSRGYGFALGLYDPDALFGDALPDDLPKLRDAAGHLTPLPLASQAVFYMGPKKFMLEDSTETPCLRVNRLKLRELLATGIDVQWGKEADRIEEDDDKVTVFFKDGTSATGDVLIGTDGVHSSVRPHVLKKPNSEVLELSPNVIVVGETKLRGKEFEQQLQMGHSCYMTFGPGFSLFVGLNRVSEDSKEGDYYWLMAGNDDTVGQDDHWAKAATAEERLKWALGKVQVFPPPFRKTLDKTKAEDVKGNIVWHDALIPSTPAVSRVAILGDAAHPMPPARGEGAIHAIQDAIKLSKIISAADKTDFDSFKEKLNEWQQEVVATGHESILAGRRVLEFAKKAAAAAAAAAAGGGPPGGVGGAGGSPGGAGAGGPPGGAGGPPGGGFRPPPPKCWGHSTKMVDELPPLGITIAED
ncbi:early conidial development-2 protein [Rhypophila decipiens]